MLKNRTSNNITNSVYPPKGDNGTKRPLEAIEIEVVR